ncbi:MAG: T9SS type A sorting domain-containing protein [Imperialibacter sp.]|uniref:T9SS type A sorting domain-containing protein n=1 Tax=Imperialibacter sp. TaxID=2038411 RepID=UPI003A83EA2A
MNPFKNLTRMNMAKKLSLHATNGLMAILICLFIPMKVVCQLNVQATTNSITLKPLSVLTPNASVTYDAISGDTCGTQDIDNTAFYQLPWVGNNQYLDDLLDSVGWPFDPVDPAYRVEPNTVVKYRIPVAFWVYHRNDGSGGITDNQVKELIDKLNDDFRENGTGIRFYLLCLPTHINNTSKTKLSIYHQWLAPHDWIEFEYDNVMNVHVVDEVVGAGGVYLAAAPKNIFISWSTPLIKPSTITHEAGHYLGLLHTHAYHWTRNTPFAACRLEPVDRDRINLFPQCRPWLFSEKLCEMTGDGLCDTPADPKLIKPLDVTDECNLITTKKDHFGDQYNNPPSGSTKTDVGNIMSYSYGDCRLTFTKHQIGVMIHKIERAGSPGIWSSNAVQFDIFEPDNTRGMAQLFNFNSKQHHTFNYELANESQTCDVDWFYFEAQNNATHFIRTSAVSGQTNADTDVYLYKLANDELTLVTSNDDGGGNGFSLIQTTLSSGVYYIKVIPKNTSIQGHYNIELTGCYDPALVTISGASLLCGNSGSYTLNNVPANATITWDATPGSLFSASSGTGKNVNLQVISSAVNGSATLTFKVTTSCSSNIQFSIPIHIHKPTFINPMADGNPYVVYSSNSLCDGNHYLSITPQGDSDGTVNWSAPSGIPYLSSGNNVDFTVWPFQVNSATITATATNTCGSSNFSFHFTRETMNCPQSSSFLVYPNPASDEINIELQETDSTGTLMTRDLKEDFEVYLFNSSQQKLREVKSKARKKKLSVQHLPDGNYLLQIHYKDSIIPRQIIIERNR